MTAYPVDRRGVRCERQNHTILEQPCAQCIGQCAHYSEFHRRPDYSLFHLLSKAGSVYLGNQVVRVNFHGVINGRPSRVTLRLPDAQEYTFNDQQVFLMGGVVEAHTWDGDPVTLRLTSTQPLRAEDVGEDLLDLGEEVMKVTGDYRIRGTVRSRFAMGNGAVRYAVEHRAEGGGSFLHVYSRTNLERLEVWAQREAEA